MSAAWSWSFQNRNVSLRLAQSHPGIAYSKTTLGKDSAHPGRLNRQFPTILGSFWFDSIYLQLHRMLSMSEHVRGRFKDGPQDGRLPSRRVRSLHGKLCRASVLGMGTMILWFRVVSSIYVLKIL